MIKIMVSLFIPGWKTAASKSSEETVLRLNINNNNLIFMPGPGVVVAKLLFRAGFTCTKPGYLNN